MSEAEMNSYRLTSMEEPGDERMAQIMREVAEEARESNRRADQLVSARIETSTIVAKAKVEDSLRNVCIKAVAEHQPVLIVIAGPNGSGKTSMTSKILCHEWLEDSEYINPDNVARDVFGDWNNQDAVLKAANYCNEWRERCLADRKSHIFETVMSVEDKLTYILRAKEAGFFVRMFFISTLSPAINAKRVAKRVLKGGQDVPISKIISRYDKSIANCIALAPYVDRLYVYDNSEEDVSARILFRLSNGEVAKSYTDAVPDWAKNIIPRR